MTTRNGRRIQLVWLWFLREGTQGPSPSTTRPIVMAPSYQVGRADSIAKPSTKRPQVEGGYSRGIMTKSTFGRPLVSMQGGGHTIVGTAPMEAKAYGIELFFSERMGDQKRPDVINGMSWKSSIDVKTEVDKVFQKIYNTMKALYEVIDQGGPRG